MSFWNLYTEQNKTPVYISTDYNKVRSEIRRKNSEGSKPEMNIDVIFSIIQKSRLSNCSDETAKL